LPRTCATNGTIRRAARRISGERRRAPVKGGRDVNILSRLELLCKDVGRPLLMTDTFAVEVAEPVIEIGHFELRGFRRHQAVYALCQEGEQSCRPKPSLARA
jgi:class 3 adenylate cyclase